METKKIVVVRKKRRDRIKIILFLILVVTGVALGWYEVVLAAGLLAFVLHEILFSDHIFYDPGKDYRYDFSAARRLPIRLRKDGFQLQIEPKDEQLTLLLALPVRATLSGYWFDPYLEVRAGNVKYRQYYERGANGLRYLNLSELVPLVVAGGGEGVQVDLQSRHCRIAQDVELLAFDHPDYRRWRLLIIAPHADDAELAAYGLYSQAKDVHIVTLTAGEIEQEPFQHVWSDSIRASRLKGRLRAWDSIAVPLWGGVSSTQVVHLGYFCKQLPAMLGDLERIVPSRTAGLEDVRLFRQYNRIDLPSDQDSRSCGRNLLRDLEYLVGKIQPQAIVTPHPQLDPHPDHRAATQAVQQVCARLGQQPHWLLYENHLANTDQHPFGPEHSAVSVPPNFTADTVAPAVYSLQLDDVRQKDKIYALEMMHDLKSPLSFKKKFRQQLQRLIGRRSCPYGENAYYRKTVRRNELFITDKQCD